MRQRLLAAAVLVILGAMQVQAGGVTAQLDACPKTASELMPYIPPKSFLQQRRGLNPLSMRFGSNYI